MTKRVFATKTARRNGTLILAAAVLASVLAGCPQQHEGGVSYSGGKTDSQFQAGADRPPTAKTLYTMARILASQGKDRQCQFVLMRTIQQYPDFMPAYCDLAELQLRRNAVDEAIRTLTAGLRISKQDPVLLNNLGMCRLLKGEYEKALDNFTQAAGIVPHDTRYRANMAVALGMTGRYEESLSLFKQVVTAANAHYNLSVICKAREDYPRSMQEYHKAKALGYETTSEQGLTGSH